MNFNALTRSRSCRWLIFAAILFASLGAPRPILHSHSSMAGHAPDPFGSAGELERHLTTYHDQDSDVGDDDWHLHWVLGDPDRDGGMPKESHPRFSSIEQAFTLIERGLRTESIFHFVAENEVSYGTTTLDFISLASRRSIPPLIQQCGSIASASPSHLQRFACLGLLRL